MGNARQLSYIFVQANNDGQIASWLDVATEYMMVTLVSIIGSILLKMDR